MDIFPQELVDGTIDHLADDRKSLVKCAVVARGWQRASQRHLWHDIILRPVLPSSLTTHKRCAALYRVLVGSPHLLPYIRTLDIRDGFNDFSDLGTYHGFDTAWFIVEPTLPLLLPLLTSLEKLELTGGVSDIFYTRRRWASMPDAVTAGFGKIISWDSLTHITLADWSFCDHAALETILSASPAVKHICLDNLKVQTRTAAQPDALRPNFRRGLHSLELRFLGLHFIQWVMSPQFPFQWNEITTLDVSDSEVLWPRQEEPNLIPRMISPCCISLCNLTIGLLIESTDMATALSTALNECPRLIFLGVCITTRSPLSCAVQESLFSLISASIPLKTIEIWYPRLQYIDSGPDISWAVSLNTLLTGDNFPALQRVSLELFDTAPELGHVFESHLNLLKRKAQLCMEYDLPDDSDEEDNTDSDGYSDYVLE